LPAHLQVKSNDVNLAELSKESQRIMKEVFGVDKLRNLQPQAIQYALRRQSQLIVMATGGGKSLCYQLPALVRGGTTIIISPLKALIADQVNALLKLGVAAAFISSSNTATENNQVMERLCQRPLGKQTGAAAAAAAAAKTTQSTLTMTGSHGQQQQQQHLQFQPISLLYCTPEQCTTARFRECLVSMDQENRLAGFAVDEAHCISRYVHTTNIIHAFIHKFTFFRGSLVCSLTHHLNMMRN
jgi:ATP-dependent DNA helicase RecQ